MTSCHVSVCTFSRFQCVDIDWSACNGHSHGSIFTKQSILCVGPVAVHNIISAMALKIHFTAILDSVVINGVSLASCNPPSISWLLVASADEDRF